MILNKFLETIKILDGKVYNISYHQKRYESVLNSFSIQDYKDISTLIKAPTNGLYRCRFIYTPSNEIEISYHPYTKRNISSLKIIYDDTIEYEKKYLNRSLLNDLYETRDTCDDILIVKNEFITDTSMANIAFFDGQDWLTPKTPLLCGTTRARLLDENKIKEADIRVDDLESFSKIALLNAMIDFDIIHDISFIN